MFNCAQNNGIDANQLVSQVAYSYPLSGVCYCSNQLNTLQFCLANASVPTTTMLPNGTSITSYQLRTGFEAACCGPLDAVRTCNTQSGYTTVPLNYMLSNSGIPYVQFLEEECSTWDECSAPVPNVFMFTPSDASMPPYLIATDSACMDAAVRGFAWRPIACGARLLTAARCVSSFAGDRTSTWPACATSPPSRSHTTV